jgi:MFS family permease
MSDHDAVTAVTVSGAAVFGMVLALLGSIKLALARQFDLTGQRVAGLLATLNLALIPMTVLGGFLVDWWSPRLVLLLGSLLTTTALFAMSYAPTYRRATWAVLVLGFGAAAVSTATIKLMPHAFFPESGMVQRLSLGHVFIALGALVTPALADVLVYRLGFRRAVALLAVLCLAPAILCVLPPFGDAVYRALRPPSYETVQAMAGAPLTQGWKHTTESVTLFASGDLWKLGLAGLVFFFYAPLEGSITVWTTTYLADVGYGERRAAWLLSGFWAALLGSRLVVAVLPIPTYLDSALIVVPALLTVVTLGNLAGSAEKVAPRLGLLCLGFLLGPIFPSLIAKVFKAFPHDQGLAYGCVFAMGSLGGLMLAPLVRARTRKGEVRAPFRVPLFLGLALTLAALTFALTVDPGW